MTIRNLRCLTPLVMIAAVVSAQTAATKSAAKSATKAAAKSAAPARTTPPAPPLEPGLYANIITTMGTIKVKLHEKESPITVKNFQDLATARKAWTDPKTGKRTTRALYPGTICHRVIPNFMIQCGDPTGTGMGGTDPIPDEFHPALSFDSPGKLAMANAGPGTGSSQFFLTEVPTPHLNGRHTIFGQVVQNQALVGKIARVPTNGERPATPVRITRIAFQRVGPGAAAPSAKRAVAKPATKGPTKSVPKKAVTPPAAKQ